MGKYAAPGTADEVSKARVAAQAGEACRPRRRHPTRVLKLAGTVSSAGASRDLSLAALYCLQSDFPASAPRRAARQPRGQRLHAPEPPSP